MLAAGLLAVAACQTSTDDADIEDSPGASAGGNAAGGSNSASGGSSIASGGQVQLVIPPPDPITGTGGEQLGMGGNETETEVNAECARTDVSAVDTTITLPADIIILVDTSTSMVQETAFIQEKLNAFSQQIIDSGVDVRVILIANTSDGQPLDPTMTRGFGMCIAAPLGSGTCPDDTSLPSYLHVPVSVGSRDALSILIDTFPTWGPQIRPESVKSIFVVTDDDANRSETIGTPELTPTAVADAFIAEFEALDPLLLTQWSMNAVYSFTACPEAARVGSVYEELITRTGGVKGDLCLQDFQPVFDSLAEQIVANAGAEIVCEWEVPVAVDGQTFSTSLVEVTRTSTGGVVTELSQVAGEADCAPGAWHFDDPTNPSRILACAETCEAMQDDAEGKIDVVFGCEIVQGCAANEAAVLSAEGDESMACQWALPAAAAGTVLDLDTLNVRYVTENGFGVLLGEVESDAECGSVDLGWHYDTPVNPMFVVACPSTCETLALANVSRVEALFGCKTIPAVIR
jgi:hypothetical protein